MVIASRFKTKKHKEEGSFSFHGMGSKKKHSSYFSLYPITGNIDECLTLSKEGRWKPPAERERGCFSHAGWFEGLAAPQRIAGEWEGWGWPLQTVLPPPSQPCLRFPFFLLEEAEHLLLKVTALIPTARSRVYGWPLLVTQGSACTAPCLPLSDCKGAGAG